MSKHGYQIRLQPVALFPVTQGTPGRSVNHSIDEAASQVSSCARWFGIDSDAYRSAVDSYLSAVRRARSARKSELSRLSLAADA